MSTYYRDVTRVWSEPPPALCLVLTRVECSLFSGQHKSTAGQTRERGGGHTNINRTPARSVPLVKQGGGNTDLNIMQAEIMQGGREGGILNIFDNCSRLYFSGFMLDISPHSLTSYCNLVGINL